MRNRLLTLATTVALAAVVAAPAPAAVVELRVESAAGPTTIFAGSVETQPHPVDGGDGSGAHPCTGPPGAPPAATATGALDDALRAAGVPWRGSWDPSFRDFFVDSIGPFASAAPDRYWSLTVNGRFSAGGCLAQVRDGDLVQFSYASLFGGGAPGPGGTPEPAPGTGAAGATGGGASGGPARPPARARALARAATRFLRRHRGGVGAEWARLALALRAGGDTGAAARALLGGRLPGRDPGAAPPGRRLMAWRSSGSLDGDVNATALAVLAWRRSRPAAAARGASWLASVQGDDGGFGYRPGLPADVDSTGMATWALALEGRRAAARRGAGFVAAAQSTDGGFPSLPGGASNAQSTGLALVALRAAGLGAGATPAPGGPSGVDYLRALARPNGSIAYSTGAAPTPVWTTAQALLGLTGWGLLLRAS